MSGASRYYVDANVVIYIMETPASLSAGQMDFVADLESGRIKALTSELTLAECLVKPFGDFDPNAVAAYKTFLNDRSNFPVLPVSRDILIEAAAIRARVRCPLPDAIHLATAILARCDVLLTNDKRMRSVAPLQMQQWSTLSNATI